MSGRNEFQDDLVMLSIEVMELWRGQDLLSMMTIQKEEKNYLLVVCPGQAQNFKKVAPC